MSILSGGEVVAQSLVANGISTLFGIPGVQLDPVFAGLHDVSNQLRVIHPRHEQGAALMAFGYAHASGRPGTLLVVPGPGFLNATTGMLVAHACNTPVLCLAGQSERMFIGSGVGVLHELDNQIGIARSLTKWASRVEDPHQIAPGIAKALAEAQAERPRPVYLELPSDIVRMEIEYNDSIFADTDRRLPELDMDQIDGVARQLAQAQFPFLLAGGGTAAFGKSIQALAEMLGAPVGMSENGMGTIDCRHPLAFNQLGSNKLWAQADVVLALGTRLYAPVYNWGWDDDLHIIKVDIDPAELTRLPAPIEGVLGDIGQVVAALLERVPKYLDKKKDLSAPCAAVRKEVQQAMAPQQQAADILGAIRQEIGEDGIVVVDVTQINHACLELLPVHHPHTYVSSGYQGALGFGPCTAMGMKIGRPDVPVVCLTGDGGFMYAAQELATAVQFNIPVIMLIINNNSYRNVEGILNNAYGGRAIATSLQNPDFVAFAASFGVEARRVTTTREMQAALKEFVARNIPAVIDYRLDHLESPFWLRFLPQVRKQVPENPHGLVK